MLTNSTLKDQLFATDEKKGKLKKNVKKTGEKQLKLTSWKQCKGKRKMEQPSTSSDSIICPMCEEEFTESIGGLDSVHKMQRKMA